MADALEVAITAVREAGALLRQGWKRRVEILETTAHDLKLQMDVECEDVIREILTEAFPTYGIHCEESGGAISPAAPTWIVDPLDGSVNYARHIPHFCASVALQVRERCVLGVIYDPLADELFLAEEGLGAFLNGDLISVSATEELAAANVAVGFAKSVESIASILPEISDLAHAVHKIHVMGSAALDMAYVAAGRFDAFVEYGLRIWDVAAGSVLVREAGGRVALAPRGPDLWDARADNGRLWPA